MKNAPQKNYKDIKKKISEEYIFIFRQYACPVILKEQKNCKLSRLDCSDEKTSRVHKHNSHLDVQWPYLHLSNDCETGTYRYTCNILM